MIKATWARGAVVVLVGMTFAFGCGGTGMNPNGSGGAAGGTTVDSGGSISGKTGPWGGGVAGAKSSGGSAGSTEMCYVDPPCQSSFRCVSSNSYQAQTTNWDCHSVCGPGPCSGAFCQDSGSPIACPAGTRCVAGGFNNPNEGCRPIPDAGLKDPADAAASDTGSVDTQGADRGLKAPLDALTDTSQKRPLDVGAPDVAGICVPGEQRCKDKDVLEVCAADGKWWNVRGCDFACRDDACVGECDPGFRRRCRANSNTPQACDSTNTWVDEPACSGSTPYCATGQCVAACLNEGQDCSAASTACCAGTECIATGGNTSIFVGSSSFTCQAIPACAAQDSACAANTDCCAGLDCTAGKCVAKQTACLDARADGVCGGTSGATCCPGTECKSEYSFEQPGCIPSTAGLKDTGCPREQPAFHEACRASKLGLECTYSDWVKQPGVFFQCTCSYHGWSCTEGHYVH